MRSFRTLLSPRDWLYSLSLLIPLSLYNLSTKLQHIIELEAVGLLEGVHLLRSNFFFSLGFSLWWIGMLAIGRRGPVRWAVLVVLHTTAFVYAVIVTAAYQYFVATGSALDYNLIALALTSFGELKPILASEVSLRSFAIACGYVFFGPPLLVFTANRFHLCSKDSVASDSQPLLGWSMLPLSIAFLLLALIPTASSLGKSFSRDPLLHVLMTAAEREEVTELANRSDVSSAPVEASLVSRPARKTRNLVLIILEFTGASSVTPYNEAMATTPYLDELVKNSLLVERAYSTVPHTSKALVSVVCGIEPRPVRSISEALPGLIPATCLPELLDQHGYHTVFFQSASEFFQDRRQLVANFGYQDFYPGESMKSRGFERANYFGFEDDIMLAPSRSWLTRNGDQPFFATYLTVTPHHQYLAPTRYGRVEFTDRKNHNLYLNAVRYQDFFVENLISQYKELDLYDETIFVIIGDHGEAFGEHRRAKHDDILYDEVMKVPFLVHAPEVFGGGERVAGPASLLDVLPSAADLLGFDIARLSIREALSCRFLGIVRSFSVASTRTSAWAVWRVGKSSSITMTIGPTSCSTSRPIPGRRRTSRGRLGRTCSSGARSFASGVRVSMRRTGGIIAIKSRFPCSIRDHPSRTRWTRSSTAASLWSATISPTPRLGRARASASPTTSRF